MKRPSKRFISSKIANTLVPVVLVILLLGLLATLVIGLMTLFN